VSRRDSKRTTKRRLGNRRGRSEGRSKKRNPAPKVRDPKGKGKQAEPKGQRRSALARTRARIRIASLAFGLVFLGLGVRASHLALFEDRGAARGKAQSAGLIALPPARGSILDRNGAELVVSIEAPSVYAHIADIEDPGNTARRLSPILGVKRSLLDRRLARARGFVFLKRWADPKVADRVAAADLPGVGITHEPRRRYPLGDLGAHLLGFANIDGHGVRGVERLEDHWLRGERQVVAVERDARRRALAPARLRPELAMGGDIALTLDSATQANVERALAEKVLETRAKGGVAILLDPRDGAILALAEYPSFDPNRFRNIPFSSTRPRSWADALEPGSTLKPFLVAGALESGAVGPRQSIDCEKGVFRVPGKTLRDLRPLGVIPIADVLRFSSNIGAVKIGFALGAERHHATLRAFGFGKRTGSGLPGESAGLLRDWEDWRTLDHATISFGHGVSVTALQLAAATGSLANGGVLREPRLVSARKRLSEDWRDEPIGLTRRSVSPEVAERVLAMLATVVEPGGTGARAAVPGAFVAGKTGTAQKFDAAEGRYQSDRHLAWFIGVAIAAEETFVSVIMIDEPRGKARTGGSAAAPLFARIVGEELNRRGYSEKTLEGSKRSQEQRDDPELADGSLSRRPAERG
jgi:cell division protein FtsI (penicillin-binding protein 3)